MMPRRFRSTTSRMRGVGSGAGRPPWGRALSRSTPAESPSGILRRRRRHGLVLPERGGRRRRRERPNEPEWAPVEGDPEGADPRLFGEAEGRCSPLQPRRRGAAPPRSPPPSQTGAVSAQSSAPGRRRGPRSRAPHGRPRRRRARVAAPAVRRAPGPQGQPLTRERARGAPLVADWRLRSSNTPRCARRHENQDNACLLAGRYYIKHWCGSSK
mmetsp:Transcript_99060/g.258242  ORF Transcript_99060/g.258242 Transcript_99060/m.258242 type:complete len:213 (-) Transcript_99060:70-708(-)